jgi:hypothetical protein
MPAIRLKAPAVRPIAPAAPTARIRQTSMFGKTSAALGTALLTFPAEAFKAAFLRFSQNAVLLPNCYNSMVLQALTHYRNRVLGAGYGRREGQLAWRGVEPAKKQRRKRNERSGRCERRILAKLHRSTDRLRRWTAATKPEYWATGSVADSLAGPKARSLAPCTSCQRLVRRTRQGSVPAE